MSYTKIVGLKSIIVSSCIAFFLCVGVNYHFYLKYKENITKFADSFVNTFQEEFARLEINLPFIKRNISFFLHSTPFRYVEIRTKVDKKILLKESVSASEDLLYTRRTAGNPAYPLEIILGYPKFVYPWRELIIIFSVIFSVSLGTSYVGYRGVVNYSRERLKNIGEEKVEKKDMFSSVAEKIFKLEKRLKEEQLLRSILDFPSHLWRSKNELIEYFENSLKKLNKDISYVLYMKDKFKSIVSMPQDLVFSEDIEEEEIIEKMKEKEYKYIKRYPIQTADENLGFIVVGSKERFENFEEKFLLYLFKIMQIFIPLKLFSTKILDLERQVLDLKINFDKKIKEVKSQLEKAQANLIQAAKMSSLGQLSAGIAHELNNPLTGILAYTQMTLSKLRSQNIPPEDKDKLLNYLGVIEREVKRTKEITEELLNFSRRAPEEKIKLDIRKPLEDALAVLDYEIQRKGIELIKEIPEKVPLILGNSSHLQQVFVNIIKNAIDAIENKGKIFVRVKIPAGAPSSKRYIHIEIEDTGKGIPPQDLNRIFEPFYTKKEPGKGTGLGLAISYAIIRNHLGNIEVHSEVGKGTIFRIILPICEEE